MEGNIPCIINIILRIRFVFLTPFNRAITPVFMGDDDKITDCAFSVHMTEWAPGCQIDAHSHDTQTEAMYCISGMGIAMVDGMEYLLYRIR